MGYKEQIACRSSASLDVPDIAWNRLCFATPPLPLDFEELPEGAAGGEGGWGGSKEEGRTAKLNYTQFVL